MLWPLALPWPPATQAERCGSTDLSEPKYPGERDLTRPPLNSNAALSLFFPLLPFPPPSSAQQGLSDQNYLLVISHREAQKDYSLNFPASKTIQEVRQPHTCLSPSPSVRQPHTCLSPSPSVCLSLHCVSARVLSNCSDFFGGVTM